VAGNAQVAAITRKGLKATYKALKPRGLHIAAAHMRIWSILMGVARRRIAQSGTWQSGEQAEDHDASGTPSAADL